MSKNQLGKFATTTKEGSKVLAFNLAVSTGVSDDSEEKKGGNRSGNDLEVTNLQRLAFECHYPVKGVMQHLHANLPIKNLPTIMRLTEQALYNHEIWKQPDLCIKLLDGYFKPKSSVKNDKGDSLVYKFSVVYNSGEANKTTGEIDTKYPVCITIENAYSPVQTYENGRVNTNLRGAYDNKSQQFYVTVDNFYNEMAMAYESYLSYRTAMMTRGVYDSALGIITVVEEEEPEETE